MHAKSCSPIYYTVHTNTTLPQHSSSHKIDVRLQQRRCYYVAHKHFIPFTYDRDMRLYHRISSTYRWIYVSGRCVVMTFVHAGAWSRNGRRKKLKRKKRKTTSTRLPLPVLRVGFAVRHSFSFSLHPFFNLPQRTNTSRRTVVITTTLGLWKHETLHTKRLPNIAIIPKMKISAYTSWQKKGRIER